MDKRVGVNYKLLERRNINDYLNSLRNKSLTAKETQQALQQLSTMGPEVIWVSLERLKMASEQETEFLAFVLEVLADEQTVGKVIEYLLDLLRSSNVSADKKGILLNILQNLGISLEDLPDDILNFDLDEVALGSIEQMLEDVNKRPEIAALILRELDKFDEDMLKDFMQGLIATKHNSAAFILQFLILSGRPSLVDLSLKFLVEMNTPYCYKVLHDLLNGNKANPVKIIRAINKIKVPKKVQNLKPQNLNFGRPDKIYGSNIDGSGNRILWFVWSIPQRKTLFRSVNFLINCEEGIKDCWGSVRMSQKEISNLKTDFEKESVLRILSEDYALKLLKDALFRSRQQKKFIPLESVFWLSLLPTEARRAEKMNFFPAETISYIGGDKEELITLIDEKAFEDWYITNDDVMDLAKALLSAGKKSRRTNQLKEVAVRFSREILQPLLQDYYRRLLYQADFFVNSDYPEDKELSRKILYLLKNYPKEKPEENPFFNRLIFESLTSATALILTENE